jgi:hypothetical protein
MFDLEIFTQLSVTFGLGAYIWNDSKKRAEKTESKVEVLEKRCQKIEDIQGNKLDNLSADFKEFKHDVTAKLDVLTTMIHKEKNQEGALNQTLTLLLKELERRDERNN